MHLLQNQQPPSPANLLTLPLELRTLIYHKLLQSLSAPHITFTNKPPKQSPSSPPDTNPSTYNPSTYHLHGTNIPKALLQLHPLLTQDLTTLLVTHTQNNPRPLLSTTLNLPSATHLPLSLAPSLLPQLTRLPRIWLSTITTLQLDQVWLATLSLPSLRSTLPALSRIEVHFPTAYATLEGAEGWLKCAERGDVESCGRALEEKGQLAAGRVFSVRWVRGVVVAGACDGIGLDGLEVSTLR